MHDLQNFASEGLVCDVAMSKRKMEQITINFCPSELTYRVLSPLQQISENISMSLVESPFGDFFFPLKSV